MTASDLAPSSDSARRGLRTFNIGRIVLGLLSGLAISLVLTMAGLIVADVLGRQFEGKPIIGQNERVEFLMPVILLFALPVSSTVLCFRGCGWLWKRSTLAGLASSVFLVMMTVVLMAALAYLSHEAGAQRIARDEVSNVLQLSVGLKFQALTIGAALAVLGAIAGGLAGHLLGRWRAA